VRHFHHLASSVCDHCGRSCDLNHENRYASAATCLSGCCLYLIGCRPSLGPFLVCPPPYF
jgi:hypothetical protein